MNPMAEHPLRRQVVSEMHLRRWPAIDAPALVIQILRLVDEEARRIENAILGDLPDGWRLHSSDNPRHHEGSCGKEFGWVWEQHNEASALTLFIADPGDDVMVDPHEDPALANILDWIATLPGEVMRATRTSLVSDEQQARALLPRLAFVEEELVSCHLGPKDSAQARVWSDFRLAEGQFGRMLMAANGTPPADLSRLMKRLQELGNYRNLALLGLPVARSGWKELDRIERELVELAAEVSRPQANDEDMLERVCALSLDLMSLATSGSFRMSATAAYAKLVDERLDELSPHAIPGYQSLGEFTRRRLLPAIRTCAAVVERETELSRRAASFVSLLRIRVETRIERQNAQLLGSMERSTALQLRMQQLVEGLSVVALSYYSVGLIGYLLKGVASFQQDFPIYLAQAVATPLVIAAVAFGMHRLKHSLLGNSTG